MPVQCVFDLVVQQYSKQQAVNAYADVLLLLLLLLAPDCLLLTARCTAARCTFLLCASPCIRMDVSLRMHPEALVGRVLRVFWKTDDAWFPGGVESYDASSGRHKVRNWIGLLADSIGRCSPILHLISKSSAVRVRLWVLVGVMALLL
jgi:hypothetical protein